MTIAREWLDWNQPCLPQGAAWLIDRAAATSGPHVTFGVCDLQSTICVLPGQRAGRLLLEYLIEQCQARGLQLIPPRILTPGALLGHAIAAEPVANDLESLLAWMSALRACDDESLHALLPRRPESDDVMAWHDLAGMIARVHDELTGARLTFARAARAAEGLDLQSEPERWRAVQHVHERYLEILQSAGLRDRRQALEDHLNRGGLSAGFAPACESLVLIAVPELNQLQRDVIRATVETIAVLIHAPLDLADRFDEFGCVASNREGGWSDAQIEIDDSHITLADKPDDQAQSALRLIGGFHSKYAADQVTIGLGDESPATAATIQRWAEWAGLRVHSPIGKPLAQSAPARFLQAAAEWLAEPRFANFAALVRHPDAEKWIRRETDHGIGDWLTLLDRYFADHLHERLTGEWLCEGDRGERLSAVYRAVHRLLSPLTGAKPATRMLADWGQPILEVLAALYEDCRDDDPDSLEACFQLRDLVAQLAAAPASLQPRVNATGALGLLLLCAQRGDAALIPPPSGDEIEMLGWLELHLDPAPALIITGFNEGLIPRAVPTDPLLTDSLRTVLGMPNRTTRYARDAYLIEAIRHSRESLAVIVGKHTAEGEPLSPSRLLLACEPETLVQRIKTMCNGAANGRKAAHFGPRSSALQSCFTIPTLPQLPPPKHMRITDFRTYLACPYRYALDVLLGLEAISDACMELDALSFGSLAHEVLCDFGTDEDIRHSVHAEEIEKFLLAALAKRARRHFGSSPLPAVRLQLARLEQRLRSFAKFQAQHRNSGWLIKYCEHKFDGVALDIPDQEPMPLHGKVDRIDFNDSGDCLIIDYKTSESGASPHKSHHGRESICDQWQDLQLPLYHYLATRSQLGIAPDANIQLAYINLPKQSDGTSLSCAEWTREHLDHALEAARDVVKQIRAGEFPLCKDFDGFDCFARICQTTVYRGEENENGEEGEE